MFTIFHLFELIGVIVGLYFGIKIGYENFGWFGFIIGGFSGAIVGFVLGKTPLWLSLAHVKLELKRCDTKTLKDRLNKDPFIPHLIAAELDRRGELVEK